MHVFLTGPVQIGKSTLLRASLDALQPQKLGGFRTVSAQPQADGSRPVYLHPACSPDELHESANRIGIRRPGLGIVSFPAAFETAGLAALAGAEDCDLLLMDEIGRMERRAEGYSARILTLLDGGVPILGVVQKKADTPLAQPAAALPPILGKEAADGKKVHEMSVSQTGSRLRGSRFALSAQKIRRGGNIFSPNHPLTFSDRADIMAPEIRKGADTR